MEGNPTQNAKLPKNFVDLLSQNPNRLWAALLVNQLVKRKITKYYLSPGLRNAPLIAALNYHPNVQVESVIDERSAAYQALGSILATEQNAALVCTSGTALANYFPAVLEAYYSNLPLLVISADRPLNAVASGAPQTIKQIGLFGDFALSLSLEQWMTNPTDFVETLNRFLSSTDKSPLHINIPFQEPLGSAPIPFDPDLTKQTLNILLTPQFDGPKNDFKSANLKEIKKIDQALSLSASPLIVVGEIKKISEQQAMISFLEQTNIPFYLDVTSGIKYHFDLESRVIPSFEHTEVIEYLNALHVDFILHFGGRLVSREYTRFLHMNADIKIVHICSSHRWDFERPICLRLLGSLQQICPHLNAKSSRRIDDTGWHRDWVKKKYQMIEESPLSFAQISKAVIESIPEGSNLFVGNSTAIRAFDNFIPLQFKKDIFLYSNRGVNGIEGHIATAIGIAESTKRQTTLVLGDISFLYDLGSLQSIQELQTPLLIILVNDGGGGIFNLLPIAKEEDLLPYITTPHRLHFKEIAKQFSLPYARVSSSRELSKCYPYMKRGLLEIILDPENNLRVYKKLKTVKST